jgi:hypothetical protein
MTDPRDEALRACVEALEEARDDLIAWGAYASDYFKDKHDFDGDVARIDAAIATARAALEAPTVDARADERAACIALVYGHAGSDNDAQRIVDAIRARDAATP